MGIICNYMVKSIKSLKVFPYGGNVTSSLGPNIFYMTNVIC